MIKIALTLMDMKEKLFFKIFKRIYVKIKIFMLYQLNHIKLILIKKK